MLRGMRMPIPMFSTRRAAIALAAAVATTACSSEHPATPPATQQTPTATEAPLQETSSPYDALPQQARKVMDTPFTGDFDALVERRMIRVAVTFNRTHYFIDKGQERGLTYESLKKFENDLNAELTTGHLKVHVVPVPMPRDL